jgi:hypothetical protein
VGETWPVLTAEATPHLATQSWTFGVEGLVEQPQTWSWEQMYALPEVIEPETTTFVCGSPAFADAATEVLIGAADIRVERFGPSG